jgi:hypothetical protein
MALVRPGAEQLSADFFEPGSRYSRKHFDPGTMLGPPVRGARKSAKWNFRVTRSGAAGF